MMKNVPTVGTQVAKNVQVDDNAAEGIGEARDGTMGASDLTTDAPGSGNGEVVEADRPAASNGHVAKKRKRQKALAAVASNGHVSKVAQRKPAGSNGAVVTDDPLAEREHDLEPQAAVIEELDDVEAEPEVPAVDGAVVEELDDAEAELEVPAVEGAVVEELDDAEPAEDELSPDGPPVDGGRRARRRAARRAKPDGDDAPSRGRAARRSKAGDVAPRGRATKRSKPGGADAPLRGRAARRSKAGGADAPLRGRAAKRPKAAGGDAPLRGRAARRSKAGGADAPLRGRAARRAKAAALATPAARRASLVATAAGITAAAAGAEAQPDHTGRKRAAKITRRLAAVVAIAMVPSSVYALTVVDGPSAALSRADASYLSAQLMTADQRVRRQLVRLKARQTSGAIARTRDATLTARSLLIELDNAGGRDAERLRRALKLESAWLDAVGSVLSNPRSPLRDELVARDALLRPALNALPVREGRRKGGAEGLVRYAKSRAAAARR